MNRKKRVFIILMLISSLTCVSIVQVSAESKKRCLTERDAFNCKITADEYMDYYDYERQWNVYRTNWGLVAKDVTKVWTDDVDDKIFILRKNDGIREIDFSHWTGNKNICYKSSLISKKAEKLFPNYCQEIFLKDASGNVFYTGYGKCDTFWKHHSQKECRADEKVWKNEKVLEGVKKCWSSNGVFAYVKDNALYMTGWDGKQSMQCWERSEQVKTFMQGKGNQIKEVVVSEAEKGTDYCMFALLKDGSVWGMGKNKHKMLLKPKTDYVENFVQIIPGNVERIGVCEDRVAILKKDKSLWIWGREMEKGTGKCSAKPTKITGSVKEFTINGSKDYCHMLILKADHTAYGLGGKNYVKVFSEKNAKLWYTKPVKLMKNIKHVYSGGAIDAGGGANTYLLTRKNKLYWSGKVSCYRPFYQWANGKTWTLRLKHTPMKWSAAFEKKIGGE